MLNGKGVAKTMRGERMLERSFSLRSYRHCVNPLGIPAKLNAHSGRNPNGMPGCTRTPSERSDAGISIVQEVFGFVKRNLSGAKRRKNTSSSERGAGKGAAALVPAS